MNLVVCASLLLSGIGSIQTPANRPYTVSPSLREVSNLAAFRKALPLQPAHLAALSRNLFLTCPSDDTALYWVYGRNDYAEVPSLVTSDNVLQIGHVFFESTLRRIEEHDLSNDVAAMTRAMLGQANRRLASVGKGPLATAALRNVAYFGVAARLLGLNDAIAPAAADMVRKELQRIDAHQDFALSAVLPYDLDYSQFIVRGHYTKTPKLGRYFRAMMWYGLVPFPVERTADRGNELLVEQIRQSLLICRDLADSGADVRWRRVYGLTSLYAGKANQATPAAWLTVSESVFGKRAPIASYEDETLVRRFADLAKRTFKPAIVSQRQRGARAGAVQFRFMGQRAIPDSVVFQNVTDPDMRPMPTGLDVMATLGSARATAILDANPARYNPKAWSEYPTRRREQIARLASLNEASWRQDLYWSWLDCLRKNLAPVPAGYPSFMRTEAWNDHALNASLASWAALRHDTILYGEQTVSEMGGDDEETSRLKGYVEPNLPVYRRERALIVQLRDALASAGYLKGDIGTRSTKQLDAFVAFLDFLISVSERELANRRLKAAEHLRIRRIEGEIESLHNTIQQIATGYQILTEDDLDIALVADVHTANGAALTVGQGRADHLIAIVPIEGQLVLARGSALSFYEFYQPISDRLTDEAWKKRLAEGKAPARPHWVASFHVPVPLKGRDE
ncbi:MAG: DUF3160 domain-containing protein [Fimbriimonadaceae bacterium]|nr:DUF3160 domain-containing protein [Fimbriimonadaceae bacterium]